MAAPPAEGAPPVQDSGTAAPPAAAAAAAASAAAAVAVAAGGDTGEAIGALASAGSGRQSNGIGAAAAVVASASAGPSASSTAQARRREARRVGAASLFAAAVMWLVVAPALAAGLFETAFIVTKEAWSDRGPIGALPWDQPLRSLALGAFLLNAWAYGCQVGVPRRAASVLRAMGLLRPRGGEEGGAPGEGGVVAAEVEGGGGGGAGGRGGGGGGGEERGRGRGGGRGRGAARVASPPPLFWEERIEVCICVWVCRWGG